MRHATILSWACVGLAVTATATATAARADEACPMDFTAAAGGSWSTWVAEAIDACLADPACAAGGGPTTDAQMAALMRPAHTRSPTGAFARGGATLGGRARALRAGGPMARDAHLQLAASGQAGWYRGVRVCGRTAVDVGARTQGSSGAGIVFPHGFWAVALGFEQDWQVQPSLAAPRRWLRRAYTSNRGSFGFAVATWRGRDGASSSVIPMRVELSWRGQAEAMASPKLLKTMSGAAYERVDGDDRLMVVPWQVTSTERIDPPDPATPAAVAIDPTRPSPLPPGHWLARLGAVGLVRDLADGTRLDLAADLVLSPRPIDCRGCQRFAGALGIDVPRGRDRWQLRVDRAPFLAIDDVVTFEDRITAGYQRPRARHTLRATGFAAATRIARTPLVTTTDVTATGGVALALDLDVGAGLTMTTELEVARSFYARLDGSVTPVAEPAARLGVVVARKFGAGGTSRVTSWR